MSETESNSLTGDVWRNILDSDALKAARQKLSIHELRTIIQIAEKSFVERMGKPYDPQGPEVTVLHHWFAEHASPSDWHDDGCRSENARDLLNAFSAAGFIVVPVTK